MARRTVDPSMLQGLVQGAANQVIQKGTPRTTDPNFPVFSTPVNEDIIVYIPRTNMVSGENGEDMQVLTSHIHEGKIGKNFTSLRCISGLAGNPMYDALGYDGSCPACEAMQEAWELYNIKLKNEAERMGVDPQNDPNDSLKPVRENILREMDLKGEEEFVTFPVVIIPTKAKFVPADDAKDSMKVVFVHWRKKRYNDSIIGALDSLMNNPGHPAGLFWFWKFSYDTGGKQATAMLSAKNAKYNVIQDAGAIATFEPLRAIAEEKAAEFTLLKAAEVVVANQFLYKEDLEIEVNKIMSKTRQMLELAKAGNGQPQLGAGQPAGQLGAGNPLASFGTAQEQPQQLGGATQQFGGVPQGEPQGQPQGQPTPNPISFQ